MKTRIRTAALLLAVFGVGIRTAGAQEWKGGGRVEGTVVDPQGAPIEGATVQLRWAEDGRGPDVKTDKKGHWAYFGLSGGKWNINVAASGFQTNATVYVISEASRNVPISTKLAAEVKQEKPVEEFLVGGKKISKEAAAALKDANDAWAAKDWEKARTNYEKVLAELPDEETLIEHIELASYNDKKYDAALGYAKKIVAIDPNNTTSWLMIAELELQGGNLEEGRAALLKVPDDKITDPRPYMNMGINFYNKAKLSDAEEWFTKAINKKPDVIDNSDAYFFRGLVRYSLKHMEDSKSDLQRYLDLNPSGENAETAKALLTSMKNGNPPKGHEKPSHSGQR